MGGNLGFSVTLHLDATRTFDLSTEVDGLGRIEMDADSLMRTTALNLQGGRFATVTGTAALIDSRCYV
jgi:hypothetical protein